MVRKAKKGKSVIKLAQYKQETGKSLSEFTVRRTLKIHLAYLKIIPIPRLTAPQKQQRLEYTQDMAGQLENYPVHGREIILARDHRNAQLARAEEAENFKNLIGLRKSTYGPKRILYEDRVVFL